MRLRLTAFSVLMIVAAAIAQAKAVKPRARTARQLGLTDTQKSQMKTIRQQARTSVEPVAEKLRQNRQTLQAAVKAGDVSQIQALSKTQGELRGQALAIRQQARSQIYAGLTNEQRQKLDDARASNKRKARRLLRT